MATRRTTVQIGSVGFYALLGAVTAFIVSGAIRETAYVAVGALAGACIGWTVRCVARRSTSGERRRAGRGAPPPSPPVTAS